MVSTGLENNRISLLYVEDEPESRADLVQILLKNYPDIQLHVADNGNTGLELFKQHKTDIVITDINMPDADGIRMSASIKEISPSTEIIVLTAYSDTKYLLQAIEIGVSDYVLKPIDIKKLFNRIDKAIAIIRSVQEAERRNKEILNLNAELAENKLNLERANQELESFNYTVAHDLRSPMVSISGFTQLLLDRCAPMLDDDAKGYLEIIYRETVRMNTLVSALLKFSLDKRKHPVKSMTSLSNIAREIKVNLMLQEPHRQVDFCIEEGVNGFCDPQLIRVVLENLLGNAWKYSARKDKARIEFGTINSENDDLFFVRDNGEGFDQQDAAKLFTPFHRLQCQADVEGFGIGLATVDRIIERHGGKIWAEGEKGVGATFFFTL